MAIFCVGISEAGNIDLVTEFRSILNIAGVRAVPTVTGLIGVIIGRVFIDGIALFQRFKERAGPELGIVVKAQLFHQILWVQPLDCYLQRCHRAIAAEAQRWQIGDAGLTELPDVGRAHGIKILLVSR